MTRVAVVGGGWAGSAASLSAARAGVSVHLFERTDMLLGAGLVGGIMRNNGRYTAHEEALRLGGGGELFDLADRATRHKDIEFPGHKHASLYDVTRIEPMVREHLKSAGVHIHLTSRIIDLQMNGKRIESIYGQDDECFHADVYVDTTGTSGPPGNCIRYGNGCVMCIQRCPTFGPRKSLVALAGIEEQMALKRKKVPGAMSGSGKLHKESLSSQVREQLESEGVVCLPVSPELVRRAKLKAKACQQYALPEYSESIVLLDTGHAKIMTPYMPLEELRRIPGLERARYEDPYAGSKGNSVRFTAMAPRDNYLKVKGVENLFCAGEKAGIYVGHTEAICTGALAGHNAARIAVGLDPVQLPRSTAIGELIAFGREQMLTREGLKKSYTFAGSVFFERMKERNLYTTDEDVLNARMKDEDLIDAFSFPLSSHL